MCRVGTVKLKFTLLETNFSTAVMPHGDNNIDSARTGEIMTTNSDGHDIARKVSFGPIHADTPRSSVYSSDISHTSSALGRLMDPIQQINDRKGDLHQVESVYIQKRYMRFSLRSFEMRYKHYLAPSLRPKLIAPAVALFAYSLYSLFASDWFSAVKFISNWATTANVLYNLTWISFLVMGVVGVYVGLSKQILKESVETFFQYWALYVVVVGILFGNRWRVTHICNEPYANAFSAGNDRYPEIDLVMLLVGVVIYLSVYAEMRIRRLIWVVFVSFSVYSITALVFGIPLPKAVLSADGTQEYVLEADHGQAGFLSVSLVLLYLVAILGKFTLELLQRKNFLELELAEKRIDVLEKTINAIDDDNQPHTQLEQTHKRLKDAERIIEKVKLMGLARAENDGGQMAFAQELETALALIRKTEHNMTMLDFHKEVLLGPIRTGVEWKQEEVVNWLEMVVNPARAGGSRARASFSSGGPARRATTTSSEISFGRSKLALRSPKRASRGITEDDLGLSARSLMKQIGFDWSLSIPDLVDTLHENQATDLSALRLVARASLAPLAREALNVSSEIVNAFAKAVDDMYMDVPFHNGVHAAQVCHHANVLTELIGVRRFLSQTDQMALSVAALCHDVSHFGRSNAFLVETRHELAIRYNDAAVLENFHAAVTFQLIKSSAATDITAGLSRREERRFRARVIQLVLATDASTHFQHVGELRMRLTNQAMFEDPQMEETDRRVVLSTILRAADLGYHAMPLDSHIDWVERLAEEYAEQGDDEGALGLSISPMCDRRSQDVPSMQIGFMNLVVMPLFDEIFNLVKMMNPMALDSFGAVCGSLVANHTHWNVERNRQLAARGFDFQTPDEDRTLNDEKMSDGSELYIPAPFARGLSGSPASAFNVRRSHSDSVRGALTERDPRSSSDESAVSLTYSQAHGHYDDEEHV